MLVFLQSVSNVGLLDLHSWWGIDYLGGGEYLCQTCERLQQSFTTFKGLVAV